MVILNSIATPNYALPPNGGGPSRLQSARLVAAVAQLGSFAPQSLPTHTPQTDIMINKDSLLRRHHELFAEDGEPFTEDWAIHYFEKYRDALDIEYRGETHSGNFSSGEEAERIYSQRYEEEVFFWIETSTRGPKGPFTGLDDAISALGYNPKTFKMY